MQLLRTFLVLTIFMATVEKCFAANSITSDEYLRSNQKDCLQSRSLLSCIKYKAARIVWHIATNSLNLFPAENNRAFVDTQRISVVQLSEPSGVKLFDDTRSLDGENEIQKVIKFVKRAIETFVQTHALQISLGNQSGVRVMDDNPAIEESRGHHHDKKKKKWLIILPLIILMKIAHLKMTLVSLLLGTIGLNAVLVLGVGWIVYFLKFKTICRIQPHLIQTHSHVWDSDPSDYSTFGGSYQHAYTGGYNSLHDGSTYGKDWASAKAYNGYNYLDTISKRL